VQFQFRAQFEEEFFGGRERFFLGIDAMQFRSQLPYQVKFFI
jgi:hypothetical protein